MVMSKTVKSLSQLHKSLRKGWPSATENADNELNHIVLNDYGMEHGTEAAPKDPFKWPVDQNKAREAANANLDQNDATGWGNSRPHEPASGVPLNNNNSVDIKNDQSFWAHPNFYEWHDGHTTHHNPKPWDKQTATHQAMALGLIKSVPGHAHLAMPFGSVTAQPTNLQHYNYTNKLNEVNNLVRRHGFQVKYSGGQHGNAEYGIHNYDTNHLIIPDPTPANGDANQRNSTDAWRQMHELSHALTYPELNKVYGEGKRVGQMGTHRSMNDAMRSVHWEWLAAHKQRELNRQIGVHVPDETFNRELNTIMHDAVQRTVTGKFTEPSSSGFQPHSHAVPLTAALDVVRNEGKKMGLRDMHSIVQKPKQPAIQYIKNSK